MNYKLSTAAYDRIAEAFKDHLDGNYFNGSEVVRVGLPNGEKDLTVIISADLSWTSVSMPEGSYPILNSIYFRNAEIYTDDEADTIDVEEHKLGFAFLRTNQ